MERIDSVMSCNWAKKPFTIIADDLLDFLSRVHHKRTMSCYRLIKRRAREHYKIRVGLPVSCTEVPEHNKTAWCRSDGA